MAIFRFRYLTWKGPLQRVHNFCHCHSIYCIWCIPLIKGCNFAISWEQDGTVMTAEMSICLIFSAYEWHLCSALCRCPCCVWQFVFFSLSFIKFSPNLMVLCIAISTALYNCQIQYLNFNPPVSQLLCLTTFGLSLPLGVIVFMCLQPIPKMLTAFGADILLCLKVLQFFFLKCNSICVG